MHNPIKPTKPLIEADLPMKNLKETIISVIESSPNNLYSEYDSKFKDFKMGKISEEEWRKYSTELLYKVMQSHKDVFLRLKNR